MSATVLCLGEVPDELLALLRRDGYTISRDLGESLGADIVYAFVGASPDPVDSLTRLDGQVRIGLCTQTMSDDLLVSVVLKYEIDAVIEGNPPSPAALQNALDRIVDAEARRPTAPSRGGLVLGRYFEVDVSEDRARRHRQRGGLTLASPSTQTLLRRMRSVVRAMDANPLPTMPWRPYGDGADVRSGSKKDARPSLTEIFAQADPKDLLGAGTLAKQRKEFPKPPAALIRGESGSGKTLVADLMRRAFQASQQWEANKGDTMPFVKINCGGMTEHNFDHELMGTVPNQYSGIDAPVVGLLARADYGVVFLDEIGDMAPGGQSRLKALLDDHMIQPTGLPAYYLHLRVLAATNVKLETSGFQHDLRQRFTYTLDTPPLNQRREEIDRLVDFLAQNPTVNPVRRRKLAVAALSADAMRSLREHDWTDGNVRELTQVVHASVFNALQDGRSVVEKGDVSSAFTDKPVSAERQRVVNIRKDLEAADSIPVSSENDLLRAAMIHQVPILEAPSGNRWVCAGELTYSLPVDLTASLD